MLALRGRRTQPGGHERDLMIFMNDVVSNASTLLDNPVVICCRIDSSTT